MLLKEEEIKCKAIQAAADVKNIEDFVSVACSAPRPGPELPNQEPYKKPATRARSKNNSRSQVWVVVDIFPWNLVETSYFSRARKFGMARGPSDTDLKTFYHEGIDQIRLFQSLCARTPADSRESTPRPCWIFGPWILSWKWSGLKEFSIWALMFQISREFCSSATLNLAAPESPFVNTSCS